MRSVEESTYVMRERPHGQMLRIACVSRLVVEGPPHPASDGASRFRLEGLLAAPPPASFEQDVNNIFQRHDGSRKWFNKLKLDVIPL
ncbi:hypothetical protein RRG08_004639 [Elysia crispata]|uniref:Uncharacterized protein n=1 Tax=Elysia crispata TaxID=231223 RepID=A0AAE0ZEY6_9GAST|nr:hypothetical protein RRG08_004639 [Elysia crispata]